MTHDFLIRINKQTLLSKQIERERGEGEGGLKTGQKVFYAVAQPLLNHYFGCI
jgi:hypothetical protein